MKSEMVITNFLTNNRQPFEDHQFFSLSVFSGKRKHKKSF